MTSIADALGRFVAGLRPGDVPTDVADAVRLRVLDTFAAALHGVQGNHHRALMPIYSAPGPVRLLGLADTRSLRDAVTINAALAHATYFEDGSRYTGGHPASAVIPAALALAEARGLDGDALVTAIAAGYDVFLRLGRAIYPSCVKRGFQSTAILAAPASAAAAASLLGLDAAAATAAIAIGCSQGAGLKEALQASQSQPLQIGRSSEGGVVAALMAEAGLAGAPFAVENGFLKGFADDADGASVLAGLGRDWRIDETYLKTQGGCRGNHAPVDAAMRLVARDGIAVDAIDRIDVAVDSVTLAASIEPPRDAAQAQFSIAFSIAVALIAGDATPRRFSDDWLGETRTRALMARVEVVADTELDVDYPQERPARVRITTRDGRVHAFSIDRARGEPEDPLGFDDVAAKFHAIADERIGRAAAAEVVARVTGLSARDRVGDLSALLARAIPMSAKAVA